MAKRQRKEKVCENGAGENPQTRVRTSGEKNSPICMGQDQGGRGVVVVVRRQTYKRRKPRRIEGSPLGPAYPQDLRVYFPLLAIYNSEL